jgi:hypothetical protein
MQEANTTDGPHEPVKARARACGLESWLACSREGGVGRFEGMCQLDHTSVEDLYIFILSHLFSVFSPFLKP